MEGGYRGQARPRGRSRGHACTDPIGTCSANRARVRAVRGRDRQDGSGLRHSVNSKPHSAREAAHGVVGITGSLPDYVLIRRTIVHGGWKARVRRDGATDSNVTVEQRGDSAISLWNK